MPQIRGTATTAINTQTCNKPAGVVVNDVLVAHLQALSGTANATTPGAGWVRQARLADAGQGEDFEIWTKVVDGTEAASFTWGGLAVYTDITIAAYSGCSTTTPMDVTPSIQANASTTTPNSPSLTAATTNTLMVCGLCNPNTVTMTKPASMTQRANFDGQVATADEAIAATGATGTRQWSLSAGTVTLTSSLLLRGATVTLTGTVTGSITESDVVTGGKTVILTLDGDTFVAASQLSDITVVGTPVGGSAIDGGNVTLTFSGTLVQNDVVIVGGGHAAAGNVTPVTSGYTSIRNDVANVPYFGIWYKVMGATPDSNVVMPGDGNAADAAAYSSIVLRGVDTSNVLDVAITTAGPTASTNPNAPSITPTTNKCLIVAMAVSTSNDSAPGTVTNYTVASSAGGNDTGVDASSSLAYRTLATAAAEDPPAWSAWTTGTWKAATLAIRPATTTPFNDARAAIALGLDSAQSEAAGWDAKVQPNIPVANVVRTSDTVCTITLQAQSDYNITAQETITATVPAAALIGASAIVASPSFTVDVSGGGPAFLPSPTRPFLQAVKRAAYW